MPKNTLPLNLQESAKYGAQNAFPAVLSIVGTRGLSARLSSSTSVPKWATGGIALVLGYSMLGSNMGETAQSASAGVAIGGIWDVADSVSKNMTGSTLRQVIFNMFSEEEVKPWGKQ